MPTAEEVALNKQLQEQEGKDRRNSAPMDDLGNRSPDPRVELTPELVEDGGAIDDAGDPSQGGDDREPARTKPIYMSPQDQKRAEIAKRFKRDEEGNVPFNGDLNDPEMLYGKHGRPPEQQIDPEPEPEPAPAPRQEQAEKKFKIKVRGQDLELTESELLERASKVEAADSYLEESRNLLDQARQIRKDNRERDPADPHRPEGRTNAQDDVTDPSLSADPQHPEDELEGAIEEVRYGTDSKEAAQKLRKVIAKEADNAADQRQLQRLIGNDNTKSTKALKAFSEANPEIANDEAAAMVMGRNIYAIQRQELIDLGIEESKLPKDNIALAQWHQFQRVHGHPVSTQEQMLEKAKAQFQKWKGVSSQPQPQPRKESPRVEVNVNRDDRRANIPNQPTRTSAPPNAQQVRQNQSPQPRSRSDVINSMKKARGQIAG